MMPVNAGNLVHKIFHACYLAYCLVAKPTEHDQMYRIQNSPLSNRLGHDARDLRPGLYIDRFGQSLKLRLFTHFHPLPIHHGHQHSHFSVKSSGEVMGMSHRHFSRFHRPSPAMQRWLVNFAQSI